MTATVDFEETPTPATTAPRRRRRIVDEAASYLQASPAFLWALALVVLPNVTLFLNSLWKNDFGTVTQTPTLENYQALLDSEVYRTLFWRTMVTAVSASLIATVVAYIAAVIVVRYFGKFKLIVAILVLVPLLISYLMRIFAWKIILGEHGILVGAFGDLVPKNILYSQLSVILTLTYVAIPYVFLSVFVSLERIPPHITEAAGDCGASAWTTFWTVLWPLSRGGAAVGFAIAFVLTFGDYVTPAMVGGLSGTMLGSIVLQQFGIANNWPLGSAIGVVVILSGLLVLAVMSLFTRTEARYD
ncbi:ABC transporter permease [Mycolicibacterium komossense]|uniref:ABC transporter permease n=1 Tax=Mycolicibacterium komossense TaxID=1779 RepID=A0ABT3CH41_9MYCO|nr:ABC transporter permease [Mycolicibacterium komossense]MCV7228819.1 ABC transporter permease [Mycolicibacterium komossense]